MNKIKKAVSRILIFLGCALIITSIVLIIYCTFAEVRANNSVNAVRDEVILQIPNYSETIVIKNKKNNNKSENEVVPIYEIAPEMDMKSVTVYNETAEIELNYIGILRIPSLGLELPIADEWSYDNLNYAPCCFSGSAYNKGFVICAHNYVSHFGRLSEASLEDEVVFTDCDGNNFIYKIESIDVLEPTDVEKMISDEYDLTLFTCNFTGQARLAVRCMKNEDQE